MTRNIALSGFSEASEPEISVDTFDGETLMQRQTLRRVMPSRENFLWQGRDTGEGDSQDGEGGGESLAGTDPGNPVDFDPADYIGPSGAKVPDLDAVYVTVTRKTGPAPLGVAFQLRSADPNFRSFVMLGTADWSFSGDAAENYLFRHLDGNLAGEQAGTAQGPYVVHTYETPVNHTWSVTLRYPGLSPRTITNDAVLVTRNNFSRFRQFGTLDIPGWLGVTKGVRTYAMPAVTTGGRINLVMTNALGTRRLRNIVLADGATGADVAAAIVAAYDVDRSVTKAIGLDFAASDATLTVQSDCQRGTTTLSIEAGDAAGVTWAGDAPDFSTPAATGAKDTRWPIPSGITTGGALDLTIANAKGTVTCGAVFVPDGAHPLEVGAALFDRMQRLDASLKVIGVATSVDTAGPVYLASGLTQFRLAAGASLSPTTITLAAPSTPAGVTWATAPDLSATVPGATGVTVTTIDVLDPATVFATRTAYCSPAFATVAEFKAAAPLLNIPGDLPNDRYYVGADSYLVASRDRDNATDTPGNYNGWRILLHAGQTFVVTMDSVNAGPGTTNLHVSRFGDGPDPIITHDEATRGGTLLNYSDSNYRGASTFWRINFQGLYDSANPPFNAPWMCSFISAQRGQNFGLTLHDCVVSGFRDTIIGADGAAGFVFTNSLVTSWYDYGFFISIADATGWAGMAIKQKLGTKNAGRYSTGRAVLSDRYRFQPAAFYTDQFDWALEPPRAGPVARDGAPAIPEGYAAPVSGGWGTHPAGADAWAWWRANWKSFTWAGTNKDAFDHADDDLYLVCAQHGPMRFGGFGEDVALHQCEMRSLNGWSRSGRYNETLSALEQAEDAFAGQPCLRLFTSAERPYPRASASVVRCAMEGNGSAIVVVPQRTPYSASDALSPVMGVLIDGVVYRATTLSAGAFGAHYGNIALRNSRAVFSGVAPQQESIIFMGGAERPEPAGSAWNFCYNNTVVFGRDLLACNPNANNGFVRLVNRALDKRMAVEWNNLVLQYAPVRNSADFAAPSTFAPLADTLGIGFGHAPQAGSPVLGDAVAPVPYRDGDGAVRPAEAAVGAVEGAG